MLLLLSYNISRLSNLVSDLILSILHPLAYIAFIYGYFNNLLILYILLFDKSISYNVSGNVSNASSLCILLFDRFITYNVSGHVIFLISDIRLLDKYTVYNFGNFSSIASFILFSDTYNLVRLCNSKLLILYILHPSIYNLFKVVY